MFVPPASPSIQDDAIEAVEKVLRSGRLANGPEIKEFESEFAEYIGVEHAIATNSGTSALHLSLMAMGIGKNHFVGIPSFTFFATAEAVLLAGATPVFLDIEPDYFCIDPFKIREVELDVLGKPLEAIMPVHLFGHPADMGEIDKQVLDTPIIEDACQSHGAEYRGHRTGGLAEVGCFSFYATKNMTTGEGGMITTDSEILADRMRQLRNHGQAKQYHSLGVGNNYRMTEMQAAIGRSQLRNLDYMNQRREEVAQNYTDLLLPLQNAGLLKLPKTQPYRKHAWHQYTLKILPDHRNFLLDYLNGKQVLARIYYPIPIHLQNAMKKNPFVSGDLSVTIKMANCVLSLPIFPTITEEQVLYVVESIFNFYKSELKKDTPHLKL